MRRGGGRGRARPRVTGERALARYSYAIREPAEPAVLQAQTVPVPQTVSPTPRLVFACASAAYLLFVLAGTLVPFDFTYRPLDVIRGNFGTQVLLGRGAGGLSDLAANLVLFF